MDPEKTTDLIRSMVSDAKDLAAAHVDGLRIEMREEISTLKRTSMIGGLGLAMFAIAGIVLAGAATTALQLALPAWASHLIIGGALAIAGAFALVAVKKRAVTPIKEPEKAARDAKWIAQRTREALT